MNPPREAWAMLEAAHRETVRRLLAELESAVHWTGQLSSSALSTAVATIALGELDRQRHETHHANWVKAGLDWLAAHANADGGWGDTIESRSNLSTTALVWAAFGAANADEAYRTTVDNGRAAMLRLAGLRADTTSELGDADLTRLVSAIERRYGTDRTFSVPIVMTLALSGRLGAEGWRNVRPLPFELAAFPRSWFGALRLPVVSYALPALIALGQAIHHRAPSSNPFARVLRNGLASRTLGRLESLQPSSGGFLEATPLTAFVTMALASFGQHQHPVALRAAEFLRASMRSDGSWPIDTNLATWTTTLSIKALGGRRLRQEASTDRIDRLRDWLLGQQYRDTHPYTGAAPGGWAWTDLPGGVPDADDTAGALLALRQLEPAMTPSSDSIRAAEAGVCWLLDLQNRDGGIPTFCRGWGTLPFDRSTPDLTAHALRAWGVWEPALTESTRSRMARARARAVRFLQRSQRSDGSWVPLWFGNQHTTDDENPVIGTALVLRAAGSLETPSSVTGATLPPWLLRGLQFLCSVQNPDGGWGGGSGVASTVEETSLAVAALAEFPSHGDAALRGAVWLGQRVERGEITPTPIGLYFARLWYHERLYPWIWASDALRAVLANS